MDRDSSTSKVSGYGLDIRGSRTPKDSSPSCADCLWDLSSLLSYGDRGPFSPIAKFLERKSDYSPQHNNEGKNAWCYNLRLHRILLMHRNNQHLHLHTRARQAIKRIYNCQLQIQAQSYVGQTRFLSFVKYPTSSSPNIFIL